MIALADFEYHRHLANKEAIWQLKELMAQQSAESQERIAAKVEVMRRIVALNQLREELNISQTELAAAVN